MCSSTTSGHYSPVAILWCCNYVQMGHLTVLEGRVQYQGSVGLLLWHGMIYCTTLKGWSTFSPGLLAVPSSAPSTHHWSVGQWCPHKHTASTSACLESADYNLYCLFSLLLNAMLLDVLLFKNFYFFIHFLFVTERNIERVVKTATWGRSTEATNIATGDSLQY